MRHFLMMHDKKIPIKPDVHPKMAILKRKMPTEPDIQPNMPKLGRPPKIAKIELPTNPIPVVKYMPRQAPNEGARPAVPIQNIAITPARIGMFYIFFPLKSYLVNELREIFWFSFAIIFKKFDLSESTPLIF